jgi:hypothetical protein
MRTTLMLAVLAVTAFISLAAAGAAAASAPTIEAQSVSEITSTDATVEAEINPEQARGAGRCGRSQSRANRECQLARREMARSNAFGR